MKKMIFTLLIPVVFLLASTSPSFAMDFFQSEVLIATESVNATSELKGSIPGLTNAVYGWTEQDFNTKRRSLARMCRTSSFEQVLSWAPVENSPLYTAGYLDGEKLYHVIIDLDSTIIMIVPDKGN